MERIAGVDGCRDGWLVILEDVTSGELSSEVMQTIGDLLRLHPGPEVVAIDIPLGLTQAGPRACDRLARRLLGRPRASSVFPAPLRPALRATSREQASEITRAIDGRGVSAQAWGLYARVREADEILQANPQLQGVVYEVHPEVSFMHWNGGRPLAESKKSPAGRALRARLVAGHFGARALAAVRAAHPRGQVADDDILDAFAALWTAQRLWRGFAVALPDPPPRDATGLRMGIWY